MEDPDRPADALTVLLCNIALPGIGYLVLRRYAAASFAIVGTAVTGLLMYSSPGSGSVPALVALWWSLIAIHTLHAVRGRWGARPAGASVWLSQAGGVGLVLIVSVMVSAVRSDAASILDEATDAHRRGDCESAQSTLERLDEAHRVVAGQAVVDGSVQSAACEVLIEALAREEPMDVVGGLDDYTAEPGAVWEEAWVERGRLLLDLAVQVPRDRDEYSGWAFDYLALAIEEVPSQSEQVRAAVTDFLAEVDALGGNCWSADMYDFLSGRDDTEPELAQPVAAFGELVPERLLACARAQTEGDSPSRPGYDDDLEDAIERYGQFLAAFPDDELAAQAEQELAGVEAELVAFRIEEESQGVRLAVEHGRYCNSGGAYLDAEPYDGDAADSVFAEGTDDVEAALPSALAADDVDEVALVMCVTSEGQGGVIDSCEYEVIGTGDVRSVDLIGYKYSVVVYELATGEEIDRYTEEVDGDCPFSIQCTTYDYSSASCPDTVEATYGRDDLAGIFDRW